MDPTSFPASGAVQKTLSVHMDLAAVLKLHYADTSQG